MVKWLKEINNKEYEFDTTSKIANYFLIYLTGSVIGYIYEFLYYLIIDHELVNRGFLYGPYVPVYGTGAVLLVLLLKRFKKHPIAVFLLAILITGIVEYATGAFMLEVYHRRWWNYTGLFLNLNGHICFRSLFTFAIGALILIYFIDPLICKLCDTVNSKKYICVTSFGIFIMVADLVITLMFRY